MSVFLETNHLFLRSPDGNVEGIAEMKAAGFGAVFCNIKDHAPDEWEDVLLYAQVSGVPCGPWSRMCSGEPGAEYDPEYLNLLLRVADDWASPLIVNGEQEVNGHDEYVREFVQACGSRDWAFSTEPTPYANNDWTILRDVPVLPQCFGPVYADGAELKRQWQGKGVKCVVPTYGSYSGWGPGLYPRNTPFGIYTADDCAGNFNAWSPEGVWLPCVGVPPTNGDDMQQIGPNHGVTASMNRLRDLDPGGTLLKKTGGKWPGIGTLPEDISTWKAYDKLERTLSILVTDHDESL